MNLKQENRIRKIVIAGGGSAGWMCAAALVRVFGDSDISIVLVESNEIGTVGVGEATIPHMAAFNEMLKISEPEFMRKTQGTFKLGIEFVNWRELGHSYIHPFGTYGKEIDSMPFHQYWLKGMQQGWAPKLEEFALASTAARQGRFSRPINIPGSPLSEINYAYHFDASLYAKYLSEYAQKRGVVHVEGMIEQIPLDPDTGFIQSLVLKSGQVIEGDLFIDCSGFRSLLLGKTLGIEYEDWSDLLPCDRAVAVPCERIEPLLPYTRSTAHSAGWQWRIPLQHRTGNGHVFSSRYMSVDEATAILLSNLDGPATAEPREIKFTAGRRKKIWHKNCVAIGLASGFLEPLESTSLHLIQMGVGRLISLFPDKSFHADYVDKYNEKMQNDLVGIRDFIVLHYWATRRNDSEFWRYCRNMAVPATLHRKVNMYRDGGHIERENLELFTEPSWLAVMHGQGVENRRYHPSVDVMPGLQVREKLEAMRLKVKNSVGELPSHGEFIKRYCSAENG
ncbi:MAG TPA: tryptophan 7-halogenase [Cellvibrionaceae bacterium]|nr:tryptophan 7-halogenase [Cellvibrionaceae bacterium]HNG60857.1 tryptophan 7-halogenase [Cellvibrionaceae bacterium]